MRRQWGLAESLHVNADLFGSRTASQRAGREVDPTVGGRPIRVFGGVELRVARPRVWVSMAFVKNRASARFCSRMMSPMSASSLVKPR